jgi:hypothetical protein
MNLLRLTGVVLAAGCVDAALAADTIARQDLERQLQLRYVPFKLSQGGHTVLSPGTILTVQAPGIRSNPATQFTFMNNYLDGRIKRSAASSLITDHNTVQDLQVGDGVFLYKVEVKDSGVVFHVQYCGNCDFSAFAPDPFRAGVTFQMPKNWLLQSPDLKSVCRLIEQVFAIAGGPGPGNVEPGSTRQPPPPPQPSQPPPPSNQESPAPPVRIELGQSLEQVRAALGEPTKIVDLGSKKIFVYNDLKVTFVDGKVTDVQ